MRFFYKSLESADGVKRHITTDKVSINWLVNYTWGWTVHHITLSQHTLTRVWIWRPPLHNKAPEHCFREHVKQQKVLCFICELLRFVSAVRLWISLFPFYYFITFQTPRGSCSLPDVTVTLNQLNTANGRERVLFRGISVQLSSRWFLRIILSTRRLCDSRRPHWPEDVKRYQT